MSVQSVSAYKEGSSDLFKRSFGHVDDFKSEIDGIQASKPHKVTPEFLAKIWHAKLEQAKKAINQTTQLH